MQTEVGRSQSQIEKESRFMPSKGQILQSLKTSKEYRRAFIEESVRTSLALQIKTIREQRDMSRPELARAMQKSPSWIFRLEDPNEPPPTITTLLQVADTYDTDLHISFGSFGSLLDRLEKLSPESFKTLSFDQELPVLEKQIKQEEASYQWHLINLTIDHEPKKAMTAAEKNLRELTGGDLTPDLAEHLRQHEEGRKRIGPLTCTVTIKAGTWNMSQAATGFVYPCDSEGTLTAVQELPGATYITETSHGSSPETINEPRTTKILSIESSPFLMSKEIFTRKTPGYERLLFATQTEQRARR